MLVNLPPELFSQVVNHIENPGTLRDLSLTCRALYDLVEAEGWKTFVLNQFPSFQVHPAWKDAAHALTALSRNWDRKAFIARDFEPFHTRIHTVPQGNIEVLKGKWKRPQGQTMGYQPVIDSYETWTGDEWDSRKEVVAWGAGAKLMMKTTRQGRDIEQEWQKASADTRQLEYDSGRNKIEWVSYHDPRVHAEGRDDITTLNIIQPHQRSLENVHDTEELIVGRANGELSLHRVGRTSKDPRIRQFETGGSLVRSADISKGNLPLLAACLGDSRAVLYNIRESSTNSAPISEVSCVAKTEHHCRTWSSRFLSSHKLAIGRGASHEIVSVYDVQPTGLCESPLRSFGSGRSNEKSFTSAYSIAGIPESTMATETTGNAFLTGGYDGLIRLHDMRSPSECESVIFDPTDFSAIFSLLMVGRERVVAGGAINALLKIFDIRMPGGRMYKRFETQPTERNQSTGVSDVSGSADLQPMGWNVFIAPRDTSKKWQPRQEGGPIYSLSRPSPSSTSLYVGRENSVTHFNFTSILDDHPDPVFNRSLWRRPNGRIDVQKTWDPVNSNRVLKLSMYDQTSTGNIPLKIQRDVGRTSHVPTLIPGYDERWMSVG